LLVAVGDEATIAKLDRYKEITAKLADPRKINEAEAEQLVGEGKVLYWASGIDSLSRNRLARDVDGVGVPLGR